MAMVKRKIISAPRNWGRDDLTGSARESRLEVGQFVLIDTEELVDGFNDIPIYDLDGDYSGYLNEDCLGVVGDEPEADATGSTYTELEIATALLRLGGSAGDVDNFLIFLAGNRALDGR